MNAEGVEMNAKAKREAGMLAVFETVFDDKTGEWIKHPDQETADKIRELKALGRTSRWQGACERWAKMVEAEKDTDKTHGMLQGSVYANFAND